MPTYVYEVVEKNGVGGERFEVIQPMSAEPLTKHPIDGKPVRRVITRYWVKDSFNERGAFSLPVLEVIEVR